MKTFSYGTKEYYENQLTVAEIRKTLLDEAFAERIASSKVQASEFGIYAEIMQDAEKAVDYAKNQLADHLSKEVADDK